MKYDKEIKAWVIDQLLSRCEIARGMTLASELSLPRFNCRVDLAILAEQFIGIEVKGPRDSLKRFDAQISGYNQIFDRTIVVAATCHIKRLKFHSGPFELWELTEGNALKVQNFIHGNAINFLERENFKSLLSQSRTMPNLMHEEVNCERELYLRRFEEKFEKTSKEFWKNYIQRSNNTTKISNLNPNYGRYIKKKQHQKKIEEFWSDWSRQATQMFA